MSSHEKRAAQAEELQTQLRELFNNTSLKVSHSPAYVQSPEMFVVGGEKPLTEQQAAVMPQTYDGVKIVRARPGTMQVP